LPAGPSHTARISDEGIALDESAAAVAAAAPPFRGDDWSNRQRARSLGRELRRTRFTATTKSSDPLDARRFDPPQQLLDQLDAITAPSLAPNMPQPPAADFLRPRRKESRQIAAWFVVAAGTVALIAGIGLIAWSLSSTQMLYWNLALGLTLGGQGTLILGLVLVVARLWRSSRSAANRLQEVHARLAQLQHTADALTAMRSGGAPAFYADLVRGASPQMLLANLKGQVDQLATRMGRTW
jgi:hypothetical protein